MTGASETEALELDRSDPGHRAAFRIPPFQEDGAEIAYLAGNSLGLQPRATLAVIEEELDDWARLGVEGHLEGRRPWFSYHEQLRGPAARLVGARPSEVVMMNSLTVNLHLLMVSFYRPAGSRFRILIEDSCFPSDSYAVRSQVAWHGHDPDDAVVRLRPKVGATSLTAADVREYLERHGDEVALVLIGAVNYYSGEYLDLPEIVAAAHAAGAIIGVDLAHAAGNVPLELHDWDVDFAAWCTYKYLNGSPGAVAGAFVHERHLTAEVPKLHGWWSTDPATRFRMNPVVDEPPTADSWSVSNPPILAMAPVLASLRIFDEVGMQVLRERSLHLTGYLEQVLETECAGLPVQVITPRDPARRGAQLSLRFADVDVAALTHRLRHEYGVIADARQPDVIRFAPVPLYTTYHDCWRAAVALAEALRTTAQEDPS